MEKKKKSVHYPDYLQLEKILTAQLRESEIQSAPSHDEMLFIITHQAFELWFKQIMFELESVIDCFSKNYVVESDVALSVKRLERINKIFDLITQQFAVLETMTPLDFMDFRDMLHPASGFQSAQFRVLETRLGLPDGNRINRGFIQSLTQLEQSHLKDIVNKSTLFEVIQQWLENMPFMEEGEYLFWQEYRNVIISAFEKDRDDIRNVAIAESEDKQQRLKEIDLAQQQFEAFFNKEEYSKLLSEGQRRLSQKATLASIFIYLYRDYPLLQIPFQLLSNIVTLDQNFALWRYRHGLMAGRMIGSRIGTGGSSGVGYLIQTALKQRIFSDIVNVAGMLVPRSSIPPLPENIAKKLDFVYTK